MLINDKLKKMKKLFFVKFILLLVLFSGCETINEKSEEIAKKENGVRPTKPKLGLRLGKVWDLMQKPLLEKKM